MECPGLYPLWILLLYTGISGTDGDCKPILILRTNRHLSTGENYVLLCDIDTCKHVHRIVYEKTNVTGSHSIWTPVYEGIGKLNHGALNTNTDYSLEGRIHYDEAGTHLFEIMNVTVKDYGKWRCVVEDQYRVRHKSNSTHLSVIPKPVMQHVTIEPTIPLIVAKQAETFTCNISGNYLAPEPTVQWKINNTHYERRQAYKMAQNYGLWSVYSNIKLEFDTPGKTVLTCWLKISENSPWVKGEQTVYVKYPATITYPQEELNIQVGSGHVIYCNASGYKPRITWQKNSVNIRSDDPMYSITEEYDDNGCFSRLSFQDTGMRLTCDNVAQHTGVYTCLASLDQNYRSQEISKPINVTILHTPLLEEYAQTIVRSGTETITLTCGVCSTTDTSSVWTFKGEELYGDSVEYLPGESLKLKGHHPSGKYTRTVRNSVGEIDCVIYFVDSVSDANLSTEILTYILCCMQVPLVGTLIYLILYRWKQDRTATVLFKFPCPYDSLMVTDSDTNLEKLAKEICDVVMRRIDSLIVKPGSIIVSFDIIPGWIYDISVEDAVSKIRNVVESGKFRFTTNNGTVIVAAADSFEITYRQGTMLLKKAYMQIVLFMIVWGMITYGIESPFIQKSIYLLSCMLVVLAEIYCLGTRLSTTAYLGTKRVETSISGTRSNEPACTNTRSTENEKDSIVVSFDILPGRQNDISVADAVSNIQRVVESGKFRFTTTNGAVIAASADSFAVTYDPVTMQPYMAYILLGLFLIVWGMITFGLESPYLQKSTYLLTCLLVILADIYFRVLVSFDTETQDQATEYTESKHIASKPTEDVNTTTGSKEFVDKTSDQREIVDLLTHSTSSEYVAKRNTEIIGTGARRKTVAYQLSKPYETGDSETKQEALSDSSTTSTPSAQGTLTDPTETQDRATEYKESKHITSKPTEDVNTTTESKEFVDKTSDQREIVDSVTHSTSSEYVAKRNTEIIGTGARPKTTAYQLSKPYETGDSESKQEVFSVSSTKSTPSLQDPTETQDRATEYKESKHIASKQTEDVNTTTESKEFVDKTSDQREIVDLLTHSTSSEYVAKRNTEIIGTGARPKTAAYQLSKPFETGDSETKQEALSDSSTTSTPSVQGTLTEPTETQDRDTEYKESKHIASKPTEDVNTTTESKEFVNKTSDQREIVDSPTHLTSSEHVAKKNTELIGVGARPKTTAYQLSKPYETGDSETKQEALSDSSTTSTPSVQDTVTDLTETEDRAREHEIGIKKASKPTEIENITTESNEIVDKISDQGDKVDSVIYSTRYEHVITKQTNKNANGARPKTAYQVSKPNETGYSEITQKEFAQSRTASTKITQDEMSVGGRWIDDPLYLPYYSLAGDSTFDYSDETMRTKSFQGKWPIGKPKVSKMVAAGFVYVGPGDWVECYAGCGIKLRNWRRGDNPKEEHKDCQRKNGILCKFYPEIRILHFYSTSSNTTI